MTLYKSVITTLTTLAIMLVSPINAQEEHIHNHEAPLQAETSPLMNDMSMQEHDHAAMGHTMQIPEVSGTKFTGDITGLPDAEPTQTIHLKDGDSYSITAEYVKKQVGNHALRMLAYNRSIPGPIFEVNQNSEIVLNFINKTDIDQTIHSHGVRLDNRYDGVPEITQDVVAPGEAFEYKLKFKDAGVFWYHPHTRDDYGQEMGLYGNYLITPENMDYWNPVSREIPLVIDDILIEDGEIASFYKEFTNFALLGRFGNEFLVNGEKDYSLNIQKGEVVRFYVTNVSNTRIYNLSVPGVRLKIVGGDLGKYENEYFSDNFLISPSERIVIEAYFKDEGPFTLTHTQSDKTISLADFNITKNSSESKEITDAFYKLRHNSDVEGEFAEFRRYIDSDPEKSLKLTIALAGKNIDHSEHVHIDMGSDTQDHNQHNMNVVQSTQEFQPVPPTQESLRSIQWDDPNRSDRNNITPDIYWRLIDEASGKTSMEIDDWVFKQDEVVKIRLTNDENAGHIMQHPIHLHGQQFVVLSVDGLLNNNLVWKDTALVFPGQTVDLLVKMSNTGEWMLHCHISEHLHAGMMMKFRVEDTDGNANGDAFRHSLGGHSHGH